MKRHKRVWFVVFNACTLTILRLPSWRSSDGKPLFYNFIFKTITKFAPSSVRFACLRLRRKRVPINDTIPTIRYSLDILRKNCGNCDSSRKVCKFRYDMLTYRLRASKLCANSRQLKEEKKKTLLISGSRVTHENFVMNEKQCVGIVVIILFQ